MRRCGEWQGAQARVHHLLGRGRARPLYGPPIVPADVGRRRRAGRQYPSPAACSPPCTAARLWTMRQYAGFGTAEESNARYQLPARAGADRPLGGLRPADADRATTPTTRWRAAKSARSASRSPRSRTWQLLLRRHPARRGLDLDDHQRHRRRSCSRSTSRSPSGRASPASSSPAPSRTTSSRSTSRAGRTSIPPGAVACGSITDIFAFCAERGAALEHDLHLRLPHPRGGLDRRAGGRLHARQRHRLRAGGAATPGSTSTRSRRGSRSSSTRTTTSSRRSPSSAPRAGCGRASCASASAPRTRARWMLRFHAQTAGSTLTAQQPENNVVRVDASRRWPRCWAAASRCTPTRWTRRWRCPPRRPARIALRTQQILAARDGRGRHRRSRSAARTPIERLTRDIEDGAEAYIDKIDELGGTVARHRASCSARSRRPPIATSESSRTSSADRRRRQRVRHATSRRPPTSSSSTPASGGARRAAGPPAPAPRRRPGRAAPSTRSSRAPAAATTCAAAPGRRARPRSRWARSASGCARSSASTSRRCVLKRAPRPARRGSCWRSCSCSSPRRSGAGWPTRWARRSGS